jgi:hypothetical protein
MAIVITSFTGCATAWQTTKQPAKQTDNLAQIKSEVEAAGKKVDALPEWQSYKKAAKGLREFLAADKALKATEEWQQYEKLKTVLEYQQAHQSATKK